MDDRVKLSDWIEFFTDKRFGWRFKLANLIMNDYLRNYLAVGGLVNLGNIMDLKADTVRERRMQRYAEKARKSIIEVMEM